MMKKTFIYIFSLGLLGSMHAMQNGQNGLRVESPPFVPHSLQPVSFEASTPSPDHTRTTSPVGLFEELVRDLYKTHFFWVSDPEDIRRFRDLQQRVECGDFRHLQILLRKMVNRIVAMREQEQENAPCARPGAFLGSVLWNSDEVLSRYQLNVSNY